MHWKCSFCLTQWWSPPLCYCIQTSPNYHQPPTLISTHSHWFSGWQQLLTDQGRGRVWATTLTYRYLEMYGVWASAIQVFKQMREKCDQPPPENADFHCFACFFLGISVSQFRKSLFLIFILVLSQWLRKWWRRSFCMTTRKLAFSKEVRNLEISLSKYE